VVAEMRSRASCLDESPPGGVVAKHSADVPTVDSEILWS
jgi:hypothetical protein